MNSLPNGKTVPSDSSLTNFISVAERLIRERESEILNEPIVPDELEFMGTDDNEVAEVTHLDEPNLISICEQNGHVSLFKSAEDEFVRDSSDDNESVLSEEEEEEEYEMGTKESYHKADTLKKEGDEKVQKGLWKEATDYYTQALKCRQLASLYGNRSLCYMKVGEFEKAERDCCNAIELDPFYKRIYRRRAAIRLGRKDYYGSSQDLQSLRILSYNTQLDPNIIEEYKVLLPLARLVKLEGNSTIRVRELEKVVLAQLCQIEESAAKSFKERSMWSQVVESLSMAILVSPGTARLHHERAVANFKLGKANLAETDCTAAIDLDPFNPAHYRLRAEIRKRLGKVRDSRSDEETALKLSPTGDADVSRLEEPGADPLTQPTPARTQIPPDVSSNVVRISVRDVYTSDSAELFDLSKLPDEVRVCIFS